MYNTSMDEEAREVQVNKQEVKSSRHTLESAKSFPEPVQTTNQHQHERENIIDPLYIFPTDIELAKKGAAELAKILELLPQNAKKLFTESVDWRELAAKGIEPFVTWVKSIPPDTPVTSSAIGNIMRCFTGLAGECALQQEVLSAFPREAFTQAQQVINEKSQSFFMYHKKHTPESDWEQFHIFNIPVVQKIASNYPHYFPDAARNDTRNWLANNWNEWQIRIVM